MSKIWFITGAGRGLGAEIAKAALADGDKVVATGRNADQLEATFASYGDQVLRLTLDINNEQASVDAVEVAVAKFGRIDVLVNNAGYGQLGMFEEVDSADIERQFQTNVFGLFHVTRAVLPVMRKQRSGHILNLSSIGGFLGFNSASIYCATKFAVEGFSESLAIEVAAFNIKVTIVEPGYFRTDFLDASSIRYGSKTIPDYAEASAALQTTYNQYSHQQPGDPVKLGLAVAKVAAMAEPPMRLVAGSDAFAFARDAYVKRQAELEAHKAITVGTDIAA